MVATTGVIKRGPLLLLLRLRDLVADFHVGSPSNKRKRDEDVDHKHSVVTGASKKVSVSDPRSQRPFEGSGANPQDAKSAATATTNEIYRSQGPFDGPADSKVDDLKAGSLVTEIAKSVVNKAKAALELAQEEMKQAEFKKAAAQSRKEAAIQRELELKTAEEKAADAQQKVLALQIAAAKMKLELTVLQASAEAAISLSTELEAKAKSIKQMNEKELIGDEETVLARAEEASKHAADQLSEAERTWRLFNSFSPQDIALIRSKHHSFIWINAYCLPLVFRLPYLLFFLAASNLLFFLQHPGNLFSSVFSFFDVNFRAKWPPQVRIQRLFLR